MQEKYWKECENSKDVTIFTHGEEEFVIYKGIKLQKTNDGLVLLDCRYNDFYSRVSKSDKRLLREHGFVKGCDLMMYNRDKIREARYRNDLSNFYKEKIDHNKFLSVRTQRTKTYKSIVKKVGILNRKIHDTLDLLFFYKTRKEQFEIKHKLNIDQ